MRYSTGRVGTWSLIGGTYSPGQADINNLYNEDYVSPAFSVPAYAGTPQAQVGHKIDPHYISGTINLRPLTNNRTYFLINNAQSGTFYGWNDSAHNRSHLESGTTALLTMWGWYGRATLGAKIKFKIFEIAGDNLYFKGEDTYECTEMNGVDRVHFKIMNTPIQITNGNCLIAMCATAGLIEMSGSNQSFIGGRTLNADVTYDVTGWSTALNTANIDDTGNVPIHASTNAMSNSEIFIDLGKPYRTTNIELYLEQRMQKEYAAISTSVDGINYLEWENAEIGSNETGYIDGFDGHDSIDFGATVRRVKVPINRSFRYAKFNAMAPLYTSVGYNELDFIVDETAIDFKASDVSLVAGNDAVPRVGNIATGDQCFVDLTVPANQTGYIYGISFYGKIQTGDTYIEILSFEKTGNIYKLIDRQQAIKIQVETIPSFKLHQWVLLEPLKVFVGNVIAIKVIASYEGNLVLHYDTNATASTPLIDPGNVGSASMSSVTVTNGVTDTEDWIVQCISLSPELWSVTGSVSGIMDNNAQTGISYISTKGATSGEVSFLISGPLDAALGDKFTFSTRVQGQVIKFNNANIDLLAEGDTIDASIYGTPLLYNMAFEAWQEPFINELWIDDADVGGIGDVETLRVYNRTGKLAQEVRIDMLPSTDGSHLLIELSANNVDWYGYGDAGLPLIIPDIPGGNYATIYVRSNIGSAIDKVYQTQLRTEFKVQT